MSRWMDEDDEVGWDGMGWDGLGDWFRDGDGDGD